MRRKAKRTRGQPDGKGSLGAGSPRDPAGRSAVAPETIPGRPESPPVAELRAESPPAGHADDRAPRPAPLSPGPTPAKGQRRTKHKAHSLIDKVYDWKNLWTAWRRVRANKGAHGLDRVTIKQFEADCKIHLRELQRKLVQRRYTPQPVRRVYIPKASNPKERRPLGIPVVADRIVGQALLQVLDPLFDPTLSERSFGFRKGRKAHTAISTALRDARQGFRVVLDADIKSFFDRIDHQVLMSRVRDRIADGRVLDLIEAFLKAGVMENGNVFVPDEGTPQGGVISPWLANLLLDDLDKAIEARGWRHVRYADDFVVLCRSRQEAQEALRYVKEVLESLKLSLHETKTRLTDFSEGFEFLGFRFRCYRIGIRDKSLQRFKDEVRRRTRRQQGRNVEAVIADLNPVLRGWAGYFGVAEVSYTFRHLDAWIRMRIRAFRKQRKSRRDNCRLRNRRLAKWGLLSLQECRPRARISYTGATV